MPSYKHLCDRGHEFALPYIQDHCHCPKCGELSRYIRPPEHSMVGIRMAETFRVVGSDGTILNERQVVNDTPEWNDPKLQRDSSYWGREHPKIGNQFYNRGRRRG
ncbi:hypothetical protein LCGC14_2200520 [marine sediment metagenome]|uniref:Uncharacterized protein n=1 Tax=marine sediment metagenome TaxID=412755 RepID=A0A0F9GCM5_9ZZZZ